MLNENDENSQKMLESMGKTMLNVVDIQLNIEKT